MSCHGLCAVAEGHVEEVTSLEDGDFCDSIGLSRVDPADRGIVRHRCGKGFTFRWPDGSVVRGPHRQRCEALAIPPAWTDVWVSPDPEGHLQAVGVDDAGRRQYRYHDRWTEARNAANFDRLADVGDCLRGVRRAVQHDLESDDVELRALAAMIRLMDRSLERVGNRASVNHYGTRGISTLSPDNVETSQQSVHLRFRGKGGDDHRITVFDEELSDAVAELEEDEQGWLFEIEGTVLEAADANAYLDEHSSGTVGCKDMRTWGGTATALGARLSERSPDPQIADAAAEVLHNTRSVARSSYIHPAVFDASDAEIDGAWRASRRSRWYSREERALLNLLRNREPLLAAYGPA